MGKVWVSPIILPPTTLVAPNSLKALTNPPTIPAKIPLYAKGTVIFKKVLRAFAPKVLAANSSLKSILEKPTEIALYAHLAKY